MYEDFTAYQAYKIASRDRSNSYKKILCGTQKYSQQSLWP